MPTLTLTLKQQSVKKKIEPGPDPRFTNTQLLAVLKSNLFRSIDFSTAVATVETGLRPSSDVVLLPCRTKFRN